ncbi:RES family NAD+ phosphorylase [Deinococcus sp. NW-56]|uniref:RES family NAD+ phosphorylase n=1 Tax=Deinococcus sp. NW-56 TaxID=2080419 RepID=UPI000CF443FE|nr:RES family NAD+ phosphorylase [Deinococcus sp. NW-56]
MVPQPTRLPGTIRLVSSVHRLDVATTLRAVTSGHDPALLAELAAVAGPMTAPTGIFTPAGLAQLLANTRRYGAAGRFTVAGDGRWYAGLDLDVAEAERGHHLMREYRRDRAMPGAVASLDPYQAHVQASGCCLRGAPPYDQRLILSPDDYAPGQALGAEMMRRGDPLLRYPSVRRPGGECVVVFADHALESVQLLPPRTARWTGEGLEWS